MAANIFSLSSPELSEIISSCAKNGVSKLKFGDLEIEFGKQTNSQAEEHRPDPARSSITPVEEITEKQHAEQNERAFVKDELEVREERLAMMFIEDPLGAEKLLLDEELEDDDESGDDE